MPASGKGLAPFTEEIALKILTAMLLMFALVACGKKGVMEETGEALDDAADEVGEAVDDVRDEVEDAFDR